MSEANQQIIGGALALAMGLALWFWLIPTWVEPDPDLRLPVSLVPQVIAIGFGLCGVTALANGVLAQQAKGPAADGFEPAEFRGFVAMIAMLLAATVGFQFLHFLVVAPVFVAASMWMYGPLKPISLGLTSVMGPLVIWFLGTDVLGRVLP